VGHHDTTGVRWSLVSTHAGRTRYVLAVIASVISGAMVALQTRINGEFGLALGNGTLAALISFASGLVLVAGVVLAFPQGRAGLVGVRQALRTQELPWWAILGGVGGAFLVLSQGLGAGVLGVALFSIAVVTGQTLGAVFIDTRGWVGAPVVPLTLWRALGALVVVLGVLIALDFSTDDVGPGLTLLVLPFLAGFGVGFQQAINGRVSRVARFSGTATLINFVVGTAALVLAFVVSLPFVGLPDTLPTTWWLWAGGAVGGIFIAIQVATVSIIGVLGLGVSLVTGQLVGSLLLDVFVPVGSFGISAGTIIGAAITLAGALVVTASRKPIQ
jgi:transporter family-2 protein